MTGILGRSNAVGKHSALNWLSEKHRSSEKCIYFQTLLLVPSPKLLLERFYHQYDMPQDLSNLQYTFVAVASLNTQGHS